MKTIPIKELFTTTYGTKLDLNKMELVPSSDEEAVNFVARTSKNLGVSASVKQLENIAPYESGLITVALGGAILSTNIQPKPFYTAQNIMVLQPKRQMTFNEKLYYCLCIEKNKNRYSTFGREANRTLKELPLPETVPSWINKIEARLYTDIAAPINNHKLKLDTAKWKWFRYDQIFDIKKGKRIVNSEMKPGTTPCIRPIESDNGVYDHIDIEPNHEANTITVNYNGSVAEAFYQAQPYFALDDVNVLYLKHELNPFIAMFLITLIRKEKYRFNYGRKWHLGRMNESLIKLPVTASGQPDFEFMEDYIKTLPYSKQLINGLT